MDLRMATLLLYPVWSFLLLFLAGWNLYRLWRGRKTA